MAEKYKDRPFEDCFSDFVKAWGGRDGGDCCCVSKGEDESQLFCSELVAAIFRVHLPTHCSVCLPTARIALLLVWLATVIWSSVLSLSPLVCFSDVICEVFCILVGGLGTLITGGMCFVAGTRLLCGGAGVVGAGHDYSGAGAGC